MRVAGAAQESGGGKTVYPEVELKAMGVSGTSVSGGESQEDREAVETAWRESRTE
jgi:enolase